MSNDSTVQNSDQETKSQIITTAGSENNKFFKIALALFAIVMLIIISEVGYFIFSKRGDSLFKPKKAVVQKTQERPFNIASTPTPPPLPKEGTKSIAIGSDKARRFADLLEALAAKGKLGFLEKTVINSTYSGTVLEAGFEKAERGGVEYIYRLKITDQIAKELTYWLTDKEVLDTQVSLISGTETKKIAITDIEPGDNIIIKETIDLLDSSPHSQLIFEVRRGQ